MIQTATDSDFQEIISKQPKVVVKYFASWCGSCRLFAPKFKKIAEKEAYHDVVFLDVNAEENPIARKLAGVANLPFFAVFKNGELIMADTTAKEESVEAMISKIL
jgi:thiol-disulfide isomerase/thioredoxin